MGAKKNRRNSVNNTDNTTNYKTKKQDPTILPKNKNQEEYLLNLLDDSMPIVFAIGPAGTGKTIIAVTTAIKKFKQGIINKIIITRPVVSVDEELGFLPGTLEQKMAPWTKPIFDVFREYFNSNEIEHMLKEGVIEIAPLAYMRGRTFKNSFIIADEVQLTTPNQMKMLLTRIGQGSRMAVTGDLDQSDRQYDNGLRDFLDKLLIKNYSKLSIVKFNNQDIERHEAVKEVLQIYGDE